ncbi:unnamed protein product [Angiostrongylus costaricensis]|uniref:TGF_BETA_2 domain-containing protein n=1 Tax=Angiostrongylus costaricensis TaxID=334426 RepID=A0A0R3PP60_ANGCS|nr:unnamed protein product [Angiostrongylus costaricensis]
MRIALLLLSSACAVFTINDGLTDVIQETIRYMLGFSHMPNENTKVPFRVSHRNAATMQAIYDTFVEDDGSDDGNVVRAIDPAIGKLDGHEMLIFDISGFEKEQIMRGELHFYLRRRDASKSGSARQLQAKSLCLNEYCNESQALEMIVISTEKVVWDVTKPLAEANALASNQLVIRVRGGRNKSYKDDIWHGFGEEEEPVEKVGKRLPMSNDIRVVLQEAEEEDARCQKHVTLINMKVLGWEKWIIAPPTFEAGFCSGKCPNPLPKEMHPSNHALLQSLLHSSTVPAVCCSPEHMRSMTLFYRDELGRSTIKNFENMIVESCTCQ